jgi:hypothetical protein
MKKINLKKVNKNPLCNVLIAVNVDTLVLNIISCKKKKKVATKEDIDDVYEYIDDKIERNYIDTFKYVDSKLDEAALCDAEYANKWWDECMKKELEFK